MIKAYIFEYIHVNVLIILIFDQKLHNSENDLVEDRVDINFQEIAKYMTITPITFYFEIYNINAFLHYLTSCCLKINKKFDLNF